MINRIIMPIMTLSYALIVGSGEQLDEEELTILTPTFRMRMPASGTKSHLPIIHSLACGLFTGESSNIPV